MGREVGERNSRGGKSATKEVRYGYKLLSRSGEHICMSAQYRHTSVTLGMSVKLRMHNTRYVCCPMSERVVGCAHVCVTRESCVNCGLNARGNMM